MDFDISYEAKVLERMCVEIGTPFAYKAGLLLAAGKWVELAQLKVDPLKYCSAEWYMRDAQIAAFLKKHPGLPVDPKLAVKRAEDSFFEAENLCYHTNERLSPLLYDLGHYGEGVKRIFRSWRKEIKRVLRKCPSLDELEGRFGPGSTFLNRGDLITTADKLDQNYTATRQTLSSFSSVWDETAWSRHAGANLTLEGTDLVLEECGQRYYTDETWKPRDFQTVPGNRFTVVPKTALTRRGICIEPSLNVFYQLAVGSALSRRMLNAYGWDKAIMQDYHRNLARMGSLTGSNATIDLSSASDTVCKTLVKLLLPPQWYNLLYSLRSHNTLFKGKWLRLEKFSSMGNGYTFELETLLFLTLCHTMKRETGFMEDPNFGSAISVFGDDIIVPRQLAREMISVLRFSGFVINKDKTFVDGPFRESCGGDYFRGRDVRPHFQKVNLDAPERIIACINGLLRYLNRLHDYSSWNDRGSYVPWLVNRLPRQIRRCRGPAELGDLVIHEAEPGRWDSITRNSIRYVRVWRPVANRKISYEHFRPGVQHATALYKAGKGLGNKIDDLLTSDPFRLDGMVPRIRGSYVSGYRFGRVAFS